MFCSKFALKLKQNRSVKQPGKENTVSSLKMIHENIKSKSVDVEGHDNDKQTTSGSQMETLLKIAGLPAILR